IISLKRKNAVALTYYRNNILHLFALPGLVSAIVFAHKGLAKTQVISLVGQLYPLLQRELFIYMNQEQALQYTDRLLSTMLDMGLLRHEGENLCPPAATSKAFYSFWLLNRSIQETLQRYAAVLTILKKEKTIGRGRLEKQSREFAERLAALHGINSPEFFDKNVLSTFIHALKDNELINASSEGQLEHSDTSEALLATVEELISPEIAQRLQQI
ncbi:MAG: glycerol-3-phosphate 1-O-acyltransferase PlsB, partial [Paraglaciecola chathamensis]